MASSASLPASHDRLLIFDTTLRDGEQSPGVHLTGEDKVKIGQQLARLGVDVCEIGFPGECARPITTAAKCSLRPKAISASHAIRIAAWSNAAVVMCASALSLCCSLRC